MNHLIPIAGIGLLFGAVLAVATAVINHVERKRQQNCYEQGYQRKKREEDERIIREIDKENEKILRLLKENEEKRRKAEEERKLIQEAEEKQREIDRLKSKEFSKLDDDIDKYFGSIAKLKNSESENEVFIVESPIERFKREFREKKRLVEVQKKEENPPLIERDNKPLLLRQDEKIGQSGLKFQHQSFNTENYEHALEIQKREKLREKRRKQRHRRRIKKREEKLSQSIADD